MWAKGKNAVKRALLAAAAVVLVAASVPAMGSGQQDWIKPWCRFLYYYEATGSTSQSFWERVLFSAFLADTVPDSQRTPSAPGGNMRVGI
jgi:hypothetical protein